ncbi:MAG: ATP-binding protein [Fimbriimonadaceae bacterium]|nr:ATP-binding protein [Fimbriimonadaceae bacterium]
MLVIGGNGAGKSFVIRTLSLLQGYLLGTLPIERLDLHRRRTRWLESVSVSFQICLQDGEEEFWHEIEFELAEDGRKARISRESLRVDDRILFERGQEKIQLHRDDGTPGGTAFADWTQSAVSLITPKPVNRNLQRFRELLGKIVAVKPDPTLFADSPEADAELWDLEMGNFMSCYRHRVASSDWVPHFTSPLHEAWPDFLRLRFFQIGDRRVGEADFQDAGAPTHPISYRIGGSRDRNIESELSDGQRQMMLLAALIADLQSRGAFVFIDEPESYLALGEIQYWWESLLSAKDKGRGQIVAVSHHPELAAQISSRHVRLLERSGNTAPAILRPLADDEQVQDVLRTDLRS